MLKIIDHQPPQSRHQQRANSLFGEMNITSGCRILSLGSADEKHIRALMPLHADVTVADHCSNRLEAARRLGCNTVLLRNFYSLPFENKEFDFVFSSDAIEHVIGPRNFIDKIGTSSEFAFVAWGYQAKFADEVDRISKRFYVKTPYRYFIIESHSWLPVPIVLLERARQVEICRRLKRFWPRSTDPDWSLLNFSQMRALFPTAAIRAERYCGLPKSIVAIKR